MEWALAPVTQFTRIVSDYQSYAQIYQRNQELGQELQRMKGWQEAALQLEQTNAQLRALNNVQLSPSLGFVTGEVITDSGSPFSQSGLLNVGLLDGIQDGQAAVDGLGLVGRISGVADHTSRLVFLSDVSSQVPVIIRPSGQTAILHGDNTLAPKVLFIETPDDVLPGMRVVTSGDGGVFPPELLVGQIVRTASGEARALWLPITKVWNLFVFCAILLWTKSQVRVDWSATRYLKPHRNLLRSLWQESRFNHRLRGGQAIENFA